MSELQSKRCTGCHERKPLGEYWKRAASKDGLRSRCKLCAAAYGRAYRETHKEERAAHSRAYRESRLEKLAAKQATYRETHPEEGVAYRETHKVEIAAKKRAYYETHKEEVAAYGRAYHQTPRGRAVKRAKDMRRRLFPGGRALTADMILEVKAASGGICRYCGKPFTDGHIDHIIPVSRGGTNDRENLVYCCAPCNLRKHDKNLDDWLSPEGTA